MTGLRIKDKPYNLLLYSAVILLLISLFVGKSLGELHLYDTYYITEMPPFIQFSALILLSVWVIYLLTARFLYSVKLTWTHVILTLVGTMMFITLISRGIVATITPDGSKVESIFFAVDLTSTLFIAVLGQVCYLINLSLGLVKN